MRDLPPPPWGCLYAATPAPAPAPAPRLRLRLRLRLRGSRPRSDRSRLSSHLRRHSSRRWRRVPRCTYARCRGNAATPAGTAGAAGVDGAAIRLYGARTTPTAAATAAAAAAAASAGPAAAAATGRRGALQLPRAVLTALPTATPNTARCNRIPPPVLHLPSAASTALQLPPLLQQNSPHLGFVFASSSPLK